MNAAEAGFVKLLNTTSGEDVRQGNFFGFQALQFQGKSFVILSGETLVFRLDDALREEAVVLEGASLWNPYGREKRNWIQLSATHSERWEYFYKKALALLHDA